MRLGVRPLAVAALCMVALPGSALGATITVDTTADELAPGGTCWLREAVLSANTNTGVGGCTTGDPDPTPDTIVVPGRATPYGLTVTGALEGSGETGDLDVTSGAGGDVLISGDGQSSTIIDAAALGDRVFEIPSGTVELRDLTVRGGHAPSGASGGPGPDRAAGTGDTSVGDAAGAGEDGGGIYNSGDLTLT